MSDGEIAQLGVEGENELEYNVRQGLAHDITGHQNVILHRAALNINLSDGYLGGEVGLGPGHDVHVCLLLDFVVALRYKTLGQIDGSSARQVQVRVQPGRGNDVEGGRAPCTICEALGDGHLTGAPQHHPQLVTFQHEVEPTLGTQVERRGGGGYQHVSSPD